MPSVINTNMLSLIAQNNLNKSQNQLTTAMQRLSSGLRINSAKDDPAGLAISQGFTTQINGITQATQNANDAISLAQTTEGALTEVTNNLQSIRQLAVESANATNSSSDRAALDAEVQQRLAEIDRIATQTTFNGLNVLDGSFGNAAFQVGANVGQTISVDLSTSVRTNSIGTAATATSGALSSAFPAATGGSYTTGALSNFNFSTVTAGGTNAITFGTSTDFSSATGTNATFQIDGHSVTLTANDTTASALATDLSNAMSTAGMTGYSAAASGSTVTITNANSATAVAISGVTGNAQQANLSQVGITDSAGTAGTTAESKFTVDGNTVDLTANDTNLAGLVTDIQNQLNTAAPSTYTVTASGTNAVKIAKVATGSSSTAPVIASVTNATAFTGGTSVAGSAGGLTLASGDFSVQVGTNSAVDITGTFASASDLVSAINSQVAGANATYDSTTGKISITSSDTITLAGNQAGASGALGFATLTNTGSGNLTSVNVQTVTAANDAIQRVDSALTAVSNLQSRLGAIQNRFDSTINTLGSTSVNLQAARSRIQDANFAAETSELTRTQILQQAGTAILAQANAQPQSVLTLLK